MTIDGANETDVREEIAVPLLEALGYRRGTSNDIAREWPLTYPKQFLGRKKNSDPPLRGRADYILTVAGAGRWVLETKPPHEVIDIDAIDQAISYARHPEVSAAYAVILNGVRLVIYHTSQKSSEEPRVDLEVSEPLTLAAKLAGVLSPAAIRRDYSPPIVDLGQPLAEGLRSRASIRGGEIRHQKLGWSSNFELPNEQVSHLEELSRRFNGLRIAVTGGEVRRDERSRIRARLTWSMPHDDLIRFALDKRLMDIEYIALDERISAVSTCPTVFDVVGELHVEEGEALFDIVRWTTERAGVEMHMQFCGQATGFISGMEFSGVSVARYIYTFPLVENLIFEMWSVSAFCVELDPG